MKIDSLNRRLKLLSVGTNAKTSKGDSDEQITAIMYLAPHEISGYNVCTSASSGCISACLFTAGRGAMNSVQTARLNKTKLFFENEPLFLTYLCNDLILLDDYRRNNNLSKIFIRLNGTSDIKWEDIEVPHPSADGNVRNIFEMFPDLYFYDYTKHLDRKIADIENYRLVYSRSEITTDEQIRTAISNGMNVAVVFDSGLPNTYLSLPVIDGDESDLRYLDPEGCIVGLKAKGRAKKDDSGFVIKLRNIT